MTFIHLLWTSIVRFCAGIYVFGISSLWKLDFQMITVMRLCYNVRFQDICNNGLVDNDLSKLKFQFQFPIYMYQTLLFYINV